MLDEAAYASTHHACEKVLTSRNYSLGDGYERLRSDERRD